MPVFLAVQNSMEQGESQAFDSSAFQRRTTPLQFAQETNARGQPEWACDATLRAWLTY